MARTETRPGLPLAIVVCGSLIALMTFGPRSAMGFFQLPMLEANGWDRSTFALAIAIQNLLWGLGQPLFGLISDRWGTWRVFAFSGISYAAGLYLMSIADTATMLHLSAGVLVGVGIASGSFSIVMAAFARSVPADKRSFVFGIGTAAGSAGMMVFSPISVAMIAALGWQDTLVWLAVFMLAVPLLGLFQPLVVGVDRGPEVVAEVELVEGLVDRLDLCGEFLARVREVVPRLHEQRCRRAGIRHLPNEPAQRNIPRLG